MPKFLANKAEPEEVQKFSLPALGFCASHDAPTHAHTHNTG